MMIVERADSLSDVLSEYVPMLYREDSARSSYGVRVSCSSAWMFSTDYDERIGYERKEED